MFDTVKSILFFVFILLTQLSCMVGPDFHRPLSPSVQAYDQSPLPKSTASNVLGTQKFLLEKDLPLQWWRLFHCKTLNQLIQKGFANSPDLESAKASLDLAAEDFKAEFGSLLLPSMDSSNSATRQRFSEIQIGNISKSPPIFNLYNVSVSVAYTFDVFGGARRQVEAAQANRDYEYFQWVGSEIALSANITTAAVQSASLQEQVKLTQELIKLEKKSYEIIKKQVQQGSAAPPDLLQKETALDQIIASLPDLEKNLAKSNHGLAVLVGALPAEVLPALHFDEIRLPQSLPMSLPSELVRHRPDVAAAEAQLHQAAALVGVQTAHLFPQFAISGSYGWINNSLDHLITGPNVIWKLMGPVTQPLFHGGSLWAKRKSALANYRKLQAQYRKVVLKAFQSVADSIRALDSDAKILKAQSDAMQAAKQILDLRIKQDRIGVLNELDYLNAKETYLNNRLSFIRASAAQIADTAALFQALGGGFINS